MPFIVVLVLSLMFVLRELTVSRHIKLNIALAREIIVDIGRLGSFIPPFFFELAGMIDGNDILML